MLRTFPLEGSFKVAPPLHHPGEKIRAPRIKTGIESQRHSQAAWRGRDMSSRDLKIDSVPKTFLDGNFKPSKQLQRIQMIKCRQRVELVQAGNDISIFNVGQPADVDYEVGVATHRSEFIARSLNVTVCQPKSLTDLAQSQSGQHGSPCGRVLSAGQRTPE